MILAGDVGGTSTRLGVFERQDHRLISHFERQYDSSQANSLGDLIRNFLGELSKEDLTPEQKYIGVACFGIAGPIKSDDQGKRYVAMTNIPNWPLIKEEELSQLLRLEAGKVSLLNDMSAICYGIEVLSDNDLLVLNPGKTLPGNRALIAAGTGLGEALLFWDGKNYHPSPSEGGHTDFAARNENEYKLLCYFQAQKSTEHISYEQIVSGSGLLGIYNCLLENSESSKNSDFVGSLENFNPSPNEEDQRPALISEEALKADGDSVCKQALDCFVSLYGAEAGNLALKYLAFGGVYVGGGIAPKIQQKLKDGSFMENFKAKEGIFSQQNADIPVKVILNSKVGLLGAAWYGVKR